MANPEEAAGIFQALRALGVRIAIDDFGTGYSSLAYLRRLPIDVIKVDKSFVMDADKNEGDAEIIRTILALGKTLKLHVVAEGVETDAQARLLEAAGCDIFQGFLFSRPMPAADTELSMAKGHARQGNSGLSAATG
jgi:EAL domain-containing protein (putative c-di-GMP-specific phosphodiesterase class I)